MKKLLSLVLAFSACFALVACEDETPETPNNPATHTHEYASEWSKDDTHHWYACTGENCTETKDKAEHQWNAGVVEGETKTYTCTDCGKTKSETVQIDYEVTSEEWANALSFTGVENFQMSTVSGTDTQVVSFDGTTVHTVAQHAGDSVETYFTTDGSTYTAYHVSDGVVSMNTTTESSYQNAMNLGLSQMFTFDNFTYDTASKTYKASEIVINEMVKYTDVSLSFENNQFVSATFTFCYGTNTPVTGSVTVIYGGVAEIEIPEVSIMTVTAEEWYNNRIVQGDVVITTVIDGVTYTTIANETGFTMGENLFKKEDGVCYMYKADGTVKTVTEQSYTTSENMARGAFSEFEEDYDLFTYNSETQAYECATYFTYYTDVVVKFVDGKLVYMSYYYIDGGYTRTVSVSYETREIEYPSAE